MLTTATTALAWAATGWLGHMLYRQSRYVIRLALQSRIQPVVEDPNQQLHDAYVNFRGDLPDPDRPYPQNRFRVERPEAQDTQPVAAYPAGISPILMVSTTD